VPSSVDRLLGHVLFLETAKRDIIGFDYRVSEHESETKDRRIQRGRRWAKEQAVKGDEALIDAFGIPLVFRGFLGN
jgi:hypothetical protein